MNTKFLIVGTLAGGATLFAWGTVSHMLLPVSEATLKEFKDSRAVVETIRANAPENGVYFAREGVFASVALLPDLSDKTTLMGRSLVVQFATELAAAFFLCLLMLGARAASVGGRTGLLALAAVAAGVEQLIPEWNWYGFSTAYTLAEFADLVVGWGLAGLLLATILKKMDPQAA